MWFKRNKLFNLILLVVLMINAFASPIVHAEEETMDKPLIVSLGDSITYGTGLANLNKAFPNLLGTGCFEVDNLGVSGVSSADLLAAFESPVVFSADSRTFTESIEQASVITITIGSIDLLAPARGVIESGKPITDPVQQKALEAAITKAAEDLGSNLEGIFRNIRAINSEAIILFYNIYNPFPEGGERGSFQWYLHSLGEKVVNDVNSTLIAPLNGLPGTTVLDAYSAFNGKQGDYIITGDIHPTEAGHQQLAALANNVILPILAQEIEVNFLPSTTEQTETPVTINVTTNIPGLSLMKWLPGEKTVENFQSSGTEFEGSFVATENGTYSVYVSACGVEKVSTIDITNITQPEEEPPTKEEPPVEEEPPTKEEPPVEEERPSKEKSPVKEEPIKEDPKQTPVKETLVNSDNKLPNTASSTYNFLAVGALLLLLGTVIYIIHLRKNKVVNL